MKRLKEKLNQNGGFTLVEMLIVVAIIAILVMVSFPLISANLDQAREGVDEANERSAMSMAEAYYLTHQDEVKALGTSDLEAYYYINNSTHEGKIFTKDNKTGKDNFAFDYGVSTKVRGIGTGVTQAEPKDAGVKVSISADGVITKVEWTKTGLS